MIDWPSPLLKEGFEVDVGKEKIITVNEGRYGSTIRGMQ